MKNIVKLSAISAALLASSSVAFAGEQTWENESYDAWLDGKAETTLLLNTNLNSFDINTDVKKGVVTLTGSVDSDVEKSLAEELVTGLEGVKEVENELTVMNESETESEAVNTLVDSKVTTVIKTRLLMSTDVSGTDIEVTTKGKVVELKGTVDTDAERDLALEIARNTEDVTKVVDKLEVAE